MTELVIGQKWTSPADGSPWSEPSLVMTIVDIRDGWVRYRLPTGSLNHHRIEFFKTLYPVRVDDD